MFKIGIIGTENSHGTALATLFRDDPDFSDIQVVAVGGDYPESNQKLAEEIGINSVVQRPEDMVSLVDAVMITARDGIYHAPFARPFLEAGIPLFIDKPFTVDLAEGKALAKEARERGVPVMGGSTLKYAYDVLLLANEAQKRLASEELCGGCVTAPLHIDSPYSGFFFYSSHLVEMSLAIFGYHPKAVTATRKGEHVTALVDYESFSVTNAFVGGGKQYAAQIFSKKQIYTRDVELTFITKGIASDFATMLRTGKMPQSYEELVYPVLYMNAIKESYENGKTVPLGKLEL